MLRKFLLSFAFILTLTTAVAQDYSWTEQLTTDKTIKDIDAKTLACNQGTESFSTFIQKFRTDAQFRNLRVRFAKNDDISKSCFDTLNYWNDGNGYELLQTMYKNNESWVSTGNWYRVKANEVCFYFDESYQGPDEDWDGGSGFWARFQRIQGKWYITGFMCAG